MQPEPASETRGEFTSVIDCERRLYEIDRSSVVASGSARVAKVISTLLLVLFAAVVYAKKSGDVTELQIGVKHKPASCDVKAHKGDKVKVHYKVQKVCWAYGCCVGGD